MASLAAAGKWIVLCTHNGIRALRKKSEQTFSYDFPSEWEDEGKQGSVGRKCTALTFHPSSTQLWVADKSGDVFAYDIPQICNLHAYSPPRIPLVTTVKMLKLGHVSMLLDMAFSVNGMLLVTADRDEKVRVSNYHKPHVIVGYCLGHKQFVSRLLMLSNHPNWLVTGSGDGTLRLWDFTICEELCVLSLGSTIESPGSSKTAKQTDIVTSIVYSSLGDRLVVACEGANHVKLFTLSNEDHPQILFSESLQLDAAVLALTFDPKGRLWVLQADRDKPVRLFGIDWKEIEDHFLSQFVESVLDNWEDITGRTSRALSSLYKQPSDCTLPYFNQKRKRLGEVEAKASSADTSQENLIRNEQAQNERMGNSDDSNSGHEVLNTTPKSKCLKHSALV
uniref:tRNA (guanine-N(7)-)-methyltransferase non-catalytic subunit WDR4 isoform X2 n=1 Tax=Myxine glutinosa TaxID=7769 RepID=UPI00358DEC04